MATITETFVYGELELSYWDVRVPAALMKANRAERYVPFRIMCRVIGVDRKTQLRIARAKYPDAFKELALETTQGLQPAVWMRCAECALWIGRINPEKCKITTRGTLEQFKADFAREAEKLAFEGPKKPAGKRGIIASSERMEYIFSCL
jgi:hypothetical protein